MGFNENTSATVAESMDVARAAPLPSGHKVPLPVGRTVARPAAAIPPQGLAWGVCISPSAHNTQVLHWL